MGINNNSPHDFDRRICELLEDLSNNHFMIVRIWNDVNFKRELIHIFVLNSIEESLHLLKILGPHACMNKLRFAFEK